jgi:hypothetical protein
MLGLTTRCRQLALSGVSWLRTCAEERRAAPIGVGELAARSTVCVLSTPIGTEPIHLGRTFELKSTFWCQSESRVAETRRGETPFVPKRLRSVQNRPALEANLRRITPRRHQGCVKPRLCDASRSKQSASLAGTFAERPHLVLVVRLAGADRDRARADVAPIDVPAFLGGVVRSAAGEFGHAPLNSRV